MDLIDADVGAEPYYITPFGEPLDKWWDAAKHDSIDEAHRIVRSLLNGLAHFHDQRGVHRDIKPQNVVMLPANDGGPRPVLIDFGLAHTVGDDHLTPPDGKLVGNQFATPPGAAYGAYDDPPAAWDCLGLAWLWAWMLADGQPKYGRYHWRYHRFIHFDQSEIVRAVMAVCSIESLCPTDASSMIKMLDNLGLKPQGKSQMINAVGAGTTAYRNAAEIHTKRRAEELMKRAADVENKEAAAAFVAPLVGNLAERIKVVFIRACSENLPITPTFLYPPFGDVGDASRLLDVAANHSGLMLVHCVCGNDPPPPFHITVSVYYSLWDKSGRFLPFGVNFQLDHPRISRPAGDPIEQETVDWDKLGGMWLGRERTATIEDVVDLIQTWLTDPQFWEI